ncbi:tubulin-like doman-containing protein [Deinococcus yavapaiensis]|uniref:Tubulin-like protein n=1 Tax=Deinococcus yavapaiensis KR-236 TaxID=694435 RepID=A0A318S3G5_9DEIO|nr:tubulin-like doman-containing protein [Deinococcus yavapaiensis]PYE51975.1 tubulin-like protein [Deinococcus yavapaiensis KR-236]
MNLPVHHLKRTVLIGLGGTGKEALLHAKRKYIETFGEMPPLVSFLVIDTTNDNASSVPARRPDGVVEDVKLNANELVHIVARGASQLPKVNDEVREWWPHKASLKSNIMSGAGQVRALGRLALFANAKTVYETLRNLLADARDYSKVRTPADATAIYESLGPNLTVCVAGSIAGGTGSGTFIDVALILRDLLKDEDQLFGYLVLPDIFTPNPGTQNVEANAYGALKELDYLMSRDDSWAYTFGGRRIEVHKKPFDMTFLVNRQNRAGKTFNDKENLSELIGIGMFLAGGPLGKEQADIFDNIVVQLTEGQGRFYGKTAHYASFGAAELQFETSNLDVARTREVLAEAAAWLQTPQRPWSCDTLALQTLDADAAPDVPFQAAPLDDAHKEQAAWAAWQTQLDGVAARTQELQVRAWQPQVEQWTRQLEERLRAAFKQGHSFTDLRVGLEQHAAELGKHLHALEAARDKTHAEYTELKERYTTQIRANVPTRTSGFLNLGGRSSAAEPVLTRKALASARDHAQRVGMSVARVHTVERYLARVRTHLTEFGQASARVAQWFAERTGQTRFAARASALPPRPFTLTLPPAHLPSDPSLVTVRDTPAVARVRGIGLDELLTDGYARALATAFEERATSTLRDWLANAVAQNPMDPLRREVDRTFRELDEISAPCWDYQDAWVSNPAVGHLEQLNILGVADKRDEHDPVLSPVVQDVFAGHLHKFQLVSTGDPNRVILYKVEAAIPAFALANAHVYREKYARLSGNASYHIHRAWESLPDLTPLPHVDEARELWTRARVLGHVKVAVDTGAYQYQSDRDGTLRWYPLHRSVTASFDELCRNFFLYKEMEKFVELEWSKWSADQQAKNLEKFLALSWNLANDAERPDEEREFFQAQASCTATMLERVLSSRSHRILDDFTALLE